MSSNFRKIQGLKVIKIRKSVFFKGYSLILINFQKFLTSSQDEILFFFRVFSGYFLGFFTLSIYLFNLILARK